MVNSQSFTGNEAWIKNSTLFGANSIYLLATSITYSRPNLISYAPITHIAPTATGETIGNSANLSRRIGYNSYDGVGPLQITVNGQIDLYNLGSLAGSVYTITPGLIYTMLLNGHRTYYFLDNKIGSSWLADPNPLSVVQKPYNIGSGIPVVIVDSSINAGVSENMLNYSLVFREDKV